METASRHVPVLLDEVLSALDPSRGGLFVDCTLGMGGHSEALLAANPTVRVIGIDRDVESLTLATGRLAPFGDRFSPVHADYREIASILDRMTPEIPVAGILADFGISSFQLAEADRGFSFMHEAPLDMRMDRSHGETAWDLVNTLPETDLANLIYKYGEEPRSRRIARAICRAREKAPVETTVQLAEIVARASGIPRHKQRIHPATQTFQALRIAVNAELDDLDRFLRDAISRLAPQGGRIAVITFHSLEDRIVKQTLKALAGQCSCPPGFPVCQCGSQKLIRILTRKPVGPSEREVASNPRARSAKLRIAEHIKTKTEKI